jgi:hypothetical protein
LLCRLLAVRAFEEAATAEDDAGSGGRTALEKITACGHDYFLSLSFLFLAGPRNGNLAEEMRHAGGRTCHVTRSSTDGENRARRCSRRLLLCDRLRLKRSKGLDRIIVLRSNSRPPQLSGGHPW